MRLQCSLAYLTMIFCMRSIHAEEVLSLETAHADDIVTYEPLMMAFRLTNHCDKNVRIGRGDGNGVRQVLQLEGRRKGLQEEWKAIWQQEPSLAKLRGVSEPLLFSLGKILRPGTATTLHRWVFWRDPMDNRGRPFVFDEPGKYEIRASLSISVYKNRQEGFGFKSLQVFSKPTDLRVKTPTEDDKRVLRVITRRNLVSMEAFNELSLGTVAMALPNSSLADFCNYCAALYELRQLSKDYKDESQKRRLEAWHARLASDFVFKISDRNRILRERGALYLLNAHRNNSELGNTIDLKRVSRSLASADFLASDFFNMLGLQSSAQYLHRQELLHHRDDRLDAEYLTQPTEDDTRETLVQRVSGESGVALSLAELPRELKNGKPARLVRKPRQTLRAFLDLQRPEDWYWVPDGDGYKLTYQAPTFSGRAPKHK